MKPTIRFFIAGLLATFLWLTFTQGSAQAILLNAGDAVPLPAGSSGMVTYYYYSWRNAADSTDPLVPTDGSSLTSHTVYEKYYYFADILGMRTQFVVAGSWSALYDAKLGHHDLGSDAGLGVSLFLVATWLVNEPDKDRYWVVAPWLWIPTGQYDSNKVINVGENRWEGSFQTAFHQGFGALSLEFYADMTVYGDNPDYSPRHLRLSNTPTYELQGWLRYQFTKTFHAEVGFAQLLGGWESLDGQLDGCRTERSRVRLEAGYMITPKIEIMGEIGTDVAYKGGYKSAINNMLRVLVMF
jgi:hypothetical protein